MAHTLKSLFSLLIFSLFFSCASTPTSERKESQLTYSYTQLKLMDLEQMSDLIQDRMSRYKKTEQAHLLDEAFTICFTRPNQDGMVEKLVENIRYGLDSEEQWQELVQNNVQKAIERLLSEETSVSDQVGFLILLQNLLAEFKPDYERQDESPQFESSIVDRIASAAVPLREEAVNDAKLNLMFIPYSPSVVAQELIEQRQIRLKKLLR